MFEPIDWFREERWTAGIIGLGYVGLPLAAAAADCGLPVLGFDIDESVVNQLRRGQSHVEDVTEELLGQALANGAEFTTDGEDLRRADAIFIAVPSPLGRNRQPDVSHIEGAAATIERVARPGQLISLESTTYPGTTEDIIVPAVERAGLELDRDVFVSFSPERIDPGNVLSTRDIPKIVGGVTELSGRVAEAAYQRFVEKVHIVSTARAAELTKLLENTYRAINIALVNEMAQLAHEFEIDIWEVIDAAATKPFGFQPFYPGPGVGGHCIPLDPQYLAWRARERRLPTRFIDLADQINLHMPEYVVGRLIEELNNRGRPLRATRILVAGLAYKRNVSDDRESPALDVTERIASRGGEVGVLDPHIDGERIKQRGFVPVDGGSQMAEWDVAIVLTDHDDVDYKRLASTVEFVFDTRGVYRRLAIDADNVVAL